METLLSDIKHGCRLLLRNPGFTAVVILALALGIGANTAVFSVANALLLRPGRPASAVARSVLLWLGAAVVLSLLIACVGHTAALKQYPKAYEQRVVSFLDANLAGS